MLNGSDSVSYDLFLSYNSADHTLVEEIARKIRDEHLEPFLDRWYLVPGARWRPRRGPSWPRRTTGFTKADLPAGLGQDPEQSGPGARRTGPSERGCYDRRAV
jgi:TIR domain